MRVHVDAVGVLGPGLADWTAAREVLTGRRSHAPSPLQAPQVDLLPATERRRTGMTVKLAIAVGQQAARAAQADPGLVSTIFCSSGADGEVLHEICSALAAPGREISPTRFHNSVQNAPAGYWGIATHSHAPSTSLACFDWSCAAGLIEAAAQLATDFEQVLLICFDAPYPEPLASVRRVAAAFAFSLLMSRAGARDSLARIELRPARGESQSRMIDPALEALRLGNPAARGLPLLASLAGQSQSRVVLEYVAGGQLGIDVTPCG